MSDIEPAIEPVRNTLNGESYSVFVARVAPMILSGLMGKDGWLATDSHMAVLEDQSIRSAMRLYNKLTEI